MKKKYKLMLFVLVVVATALILSSCDPNVESEVQTYTVQVPQFAEMDAKGAKAGIIINGEEVLSDDSIAKHFFANRIAPPITGFKEQKIARGSKIKTNLLGNPIDLTTTIDAESGNYIFEGFNDDEYIRVEISKDNKEFNYVHSIILDVENFPGANDEFDVVVGKGEILSANHFDSCGTAYYLSEGRVARYNFLLHGKEGGKMAWFCYNGIITDVSGEVSFTRASDFQTNCIDVVDGRVSGESNTYIAMFDKNGLNSDSFDNISEATNLTTEERQTLLSMLDKPDLAATPDSNDAIAYLNSLDVNVLRTKYALVSNGVSMSADYSTGVSRINNWPSFNSWDIGESMSKWLGPAM